MPHKCLYFKKCLLKFAGEGGISEVPAMYQALC